MNSTPLKSTTNLTSTALLAGAEQIVKAIKSWRLGGSFHYDVPQDSAKINVDVFNKDSLNNDYWVARVSDFSELSPDSRATLYAQLDKYLLGSTTLLDDSHTSHELAYIHELVDYDLTPHLLAETPQGYDGIAYYAQLIYQLQFPLKKRKFNNLVHVLRAEDGKSGYVISLAVDPTVISSEASDKNYVSASYTSVEYIELDEANGKLWWYMATSSNPGGFVPNWLAKATMNPVVAKDVPSFLKWASH